MAQPAYVTTLLEKEPRVEDITSFRFERPPGYEFQAGQWLVITFPPQGGSAATPLPEGSPGPGGSPGTASPPGPAGSSVTAGSADGAPPAAAGEQEASGGGTAGEQEDTPAPYSHHFSHSSSPLDPFVEFSTRLRGSEFKNALGALEPGAKVELEGPYGSFTLGPEMERVAFLTGGIGITCVRSILRWLGQALPSAQPSAPGRQDSADGGGMAPKEVVLLLANRSEASIAFRNELDQLAHGLPFLRVVHVLSRAGEGWQGARGHIDHDLLARELRQPSDWAYYLSGPPSMVKSMREILAGWGAEPASIKTEGFEGYE